MRKWHTAGIDRGLTVLVRVFYQDSQFLHTELKVTETERERKKRREKVRSINITVNLFNTSFYFVMRADKKVGEMMWPIFNGAKWFFSMHYCQSQRLKARKKKYSFVSLAGLPESCCVSGEKHALWFNWSGKGYDQHLTTWKCREVWTSETYLDTSTVVRHPRGQGDQHCNAGQRSC